MLTKDCLASYRNIINKRMLPSKQQHAIAIKVDVENTIITL